MTRLEQQEIITREAEQEAKEAWMKFCELLTPNDVGLLFHPTPNKVTFEVKRELLNTEEKQQLAEAFKIATDKATYHKVKLCRMKTEVPANDRLKE